MPAPSRSAVLFVSGVNNSTKQNEYLTQYMAKQKISNLAKELNVGLPNIFEFLRKNNIDVPESPNTRVEESVAEMLTHHFQPDREIKTRSDQQTNDRMQSRAAAREQKAEAARPAAPEHERDVVS